MKITVKTVDSATAELEVTGEMTVRQLKSEIYKKLSIAPSKQRLLFNGNCLRVSNYTLDQYSIKEGSELKLVLEKPEPDEKVGALPQIPPEEAVAGGEAGGEGDAAVGGQVEVQQLEEQQKKEDEEHKMEMEERDKRNLKDIHKHVTNTKKCTEWAIKILDRYDGSISTDTPVLSIDTKRVEPEQKAEAKRLEWQRAREAGEDLAALDKEDDPDEKPEPRKRRFPWHDDDNEAALPPFERSDYVALMTSIQAAQDRARPMSDRYQTLITTDPTLSIEEGLQAERLAQTVKEFNYYIGHALISLSRLEMTMNAPPPRPVKLAPTRRTEMRRVMRDLRNMPPRAPSGYIVDIQREGGPIPVGTRNAPAPTDPLTSVALGSKDKKKKDDKKKDGDGGSAASSDKKEEAGGGGEGGGKGEAKSGEEPMEQGEEQGAGKEGAGKEKEAKEGGEGGEPKKERTRDVLAKLLTGMVSGMMGSEEDEEEEGEGEGKEGEKKKEEEEKKKKEEEKKKKKKKKRRSRDSDDDDDDPKKTFAEKYVGPPGTVVTIQSIPQPPFGIPTMNPQPGPSLCIRNTGDASKPDVKVNFPMPPALQMLQDLLGGDSSSDEDEVVDKPESEMTEEEKEKKRKRDKKKEEKERKQREREARRKKREKEEEDAKEKERQLRRLGKETKAFTPKEEADLGELSDAGSVDSLDSQHDYLETHHLDNPMVRLALSATNDIEGGIRETVYDSVLDAYAHMGQPPPPDVAEEAGILEMLFEALSKHLSVLETMALMWGVEEPMKKLQPCLFQFVKNRLLKGQDPTPAPELKKAAVTKFLAPFIPSISSSMKTIFPKEGVDLPRTLYASLYSCMEDVYDIIVKKHKDGAVFAKQLHQWATKTSLLSAALLHHTSRNDDLYEDAAKQLFTVFLPGETPAMAMGYPYASIGRELKRMKTAHKFTTEELDELIVYKKGRGPSRSKPKDGGGSAGEGGGADSASKQPPPPQDPKPDGESEKQEKQAEEQPPPPPPPSSSSSQQPPGDGEQASGSSGGVGKKGGGERGGGGEGGGGGERKRGGGGGGGASVPEKWPDAMPKEWVPAIKRDREALARMNPQQPFSDAYVSGMPPKRRKMESKELASGSELMEKSLQSAIAESGATPSSGVSVDAIVNEAKSSSGLVGELDKELQEGVKERLRNDPDFNPQQFPAAEKVFQPGE